MHRYNHQLYDIRKEKSMAWSIAYPLYPAPGVSGVARDPQSRVPPANKPELNTRRRTSQTRQEYIYQALAGEQGWVYRHPSLCEDRTQVVCP